MPCCSSLGFVRDHLAVGGGMTASSGLPVCEAMPQPKRTHPLVMFPLRTIALFGAFMPGIGCYSVIAYTYLFQMDRVQNFVSADCPNVSSSLPPVSYSIGVWEPQRFFWLFILIGHLPPRIFFGALYYSFFASSNSIHSSSRWYGVICKLYAVIMIIEPTALVIVSVVDIHSHFFIHAVFYTLWLVSFGFNMLFNILLHHFSGFRNRSNQSNNAFHLKIFMFCVGVTLSVSTGFTYPHYLSVCAGWAYTAFSVAEYILVGWNSAFHLLCCRELTIVDVGLFANFETYYQRLKIDECNDIGRAQHKVRLGKESAAVSVAVGHERCDTRVRL